MSLTVAIIVPGLSVPSGYRSASIGIIKSLYNYMDVQPYVCVSQIDAKTAESLLPQFQLIKLPEIQRLTFDAWRVWPKLVATWWQVMQTNLPRVDLVHSLDAYPAGLVGHWLAKQLNVPHILTALGTYAVRWHNVPRDRLAYRNVLQQAACICPMSRGTASLMQNYFSDVLAGVPMEVVLLGTDFPQRVDRDVALQQRTNSSPLIISVGAVKPRKGYHISLASFAKVKEKLPSARYLIIGGIEQKGYYNQLQEFVTINQIEDVDFLGVISDEELESYYQQASVFLLTPQQKKLHFEGFGLVYLEAGAYGLPVVGTYTGGVPDAVQDGVTGFLVEPEDVNGLANALIRLLTDTQLAAKMGYANRKWAETLTWERYAREQYDIYQNVV